MEFFINTGTVTKASRARDILRRHGFSAFVESARGTKLTSGCGYGVVLRGETDAQHIKTLLARHGLYPLEITAAENKER